MTCRVPLKSLSIRAFFAQLDYSVQQPGAIGELLKGHLSLLVLSVSRCISAINRKDCVSTNRSTAIGVQ